MSLTGTTINRTTLSQFRGFCKELDKNNNKKDLVQLAIEMGLSKTQAQNLTKRELCRKIATTLVIPPTIPIPTDPSMADADPDYMLEQLCKEFHNDVFLEETYKWAIKAGIKGVHPDMSKNALCALLTPVKIVPPISSFGDETLSSLDPSLSFKCVERLGTKLVSDIMNIDRDSYTGPYSASLLHGSYMGPYFASLIYDAKTFEDVLCINRLTISTGRVKLFLDKKYNNVYNSIIDNGVLVMSSYFDPPKNARSNIEVILRRNDWENVKGNISNIFYYLSIDKQGRKESNFGKELVIDKDSGEYITIKVDDEEDKYTVYNSFNTIYDDDDELGRDILNQHDKFMKKFDLVYVIVYSKEVSKQFDYKKFLDLLLISF